MAARAMALGALALAAAMIATASCVPPPLRGERVVVEPSYIFALGAHQDDVEAMLGWPSRGPRFDKVSRTTEIAYAYPFPAIQAETHFPNGAVRAEMLDEITMFFNQDGVLVRMTGHPDRWYPSFSDLTVQRITVLPRVVHRSGEITPPRPAAP